MRMEDVQMDVECDSDLNRNTSSIGLCVKVNASGIGLGGNTPSMGVNFNSNTPSIGIDISPLKKKRKISSNAPPRPPSNFLEFGSRVRRWVYPNLKRFEVDERLPQEQLVAWD